MSRFGKYCDWYKCEDGTVELPIMQGINCKSVTDLFENEKELCVVEWGDDDYPCIYIYINTNTLNE